MRHRTFLTYRFWELAVVAILVLVSCKEEHKTQGGTPPPPAPSATAPNACATGGATLADPTLAPIFPKTVDGYCIDPAFDLKTYGDKAKLPIAQLCETALDGGCEEYRRFGVIRTAIFHYAQASGTGSVEVMISLFPGDAAYALYTTRISGDLDPIDPAMPKPLAAVPNGVMGTGKAYVWRGAYFVELTYTNDQETPEQMTASSGVALSSLAKSIWTNLSDKPDVPESVKSLPTENRIPLGTLYFSRDALGVSGLGAGAVGFYQAGDKRWRTVSIVKPDADQAKDAIRTLSKQPGALPISNLSDDGVEVVLSANKERPKISYVFARKGKTILGVSDEEFTPEKKLPKDEKLARLRTAITLLK